MVGPVPVTSTLYTERADHVVDPGFMELSGTSFAAPIVSGTAALILGKHPEFTPDQVKGALMVGTKPMPQANGLSEGVGEVNAARSVEISNPPSANKALNAFIVRRLRTILNVSREAVPRSVRLAPGVTSTW